MIAKSTQTRLGAGLLGATLITACSLSIPSEETLFGATGGAGTGAMSGATTEGGAPDDGSGGRAEGGGGTSAGGKHQGGMGGREQPTSGAANAGEGGDAAGGDAGAGGDPPIVLPPAILLLRYDFDDLTDLAAKDVSGNGNNGVLGGNSLPIAAPGRINGALKFDGALKQYVQLPNDILDGRQGISIAAWLYLEQATAWDRLFDFNSGESNWFYFSPTGWNPSSMAFGTRVAARTPSALAPEITMAETVSIKTWHHIAIVFAEPYLRYYLDGELKSERDGLTFGPGGLGKTNQNWIGRSVYAADPYLTGMVDDFRVYTGALTAEQVTTLAAQ